jgi:predicted ATPase
VTPTLTDELDRIATGRIYDKQVFFVRLLGFMTNTAVRRITLEQAERFEIVHERAYREYGYELIEVPPGPLADRTGTVEHHLR